MQVEARQMQVEADPMVRIGTSRLLSGAERMPISGAGRLLSVAGELILQPQRGQ
jgi:hypothetical protein